MNRRQAGFAIALTVMAVSRVQADEVILQNGVDGYTGTEDATLHEGMDFLGGTPENNSSGGFPVIFSGNTGNPMTLRRRALIRFNFSPIPKGSVITAAALRLSVAATPDAEARTYSLHRVARDWGEGNNGAPIPGGGGGGGLGTPADDGDATWRSNFHNQSLWDKPGGDFTQQASAQADFAGFGTENSFTGGGLVADAQAWLDGGLENFGWILIGQEVDEAMAPILATARNFVSSEGAQDRRPRLTLTFTPPTPNAIRNWQIYD